MSDQPPSPQLILVNAGCLAYREALALQERLHREVAGGSGRQYLLFTEHPPVVTLGKHALLSHLFDSPARLAEDDVEVVRTDRGGEVTAHMPGQLVVYPVLLLERFQLGPRRYVTLLEEAVIELLAGYGTAAYVDPARPGVWTMTAGGPAKICAVGVRFKERATMHGLALNVVNDLSLFKRMRPCGLVGGGVTSLAELLSTPPQLAQVREALAAILLRRLGESTGPATIRRAVALQWQEGLSTI